MVIRVDGANNIADIRSGYVNASVPYNGSDKDIGILSISFEAQAIAEPATILLMGGGVAAMGLARRRRRKREAAELTHD